MVWKKFWTQKVYLFMLSWIQAYFLSLGQIIQKLLYTLNMEKRCNLSHSYTFNRRSIIEGNSKFNANSLLHWYVIEEHQYGHKIVLFILYIELLKNMYTIRVENRVNLFRSSKNCWAHTNLWVATFLPYIHEICHSFN